MEHVSDRGSRFSTGLPGLDKVLKGIMPGDNIVWQVSDIEDYAAFVKPKCVHARKTGRTLVYFRFGKHRPLVEEGPGIRIYQLNPEKGFDAFIDGIHKAIETEGATGSFIFDCLSDLAVDWFSDRMLGNIFMLTCPYLYDLQVVAYFGLLRNNHSFHAISPIAETTQVLVDVYRHKDKLYIHPLKVQQRFSPTIHMLHVWEKDAFNPVTESTIISEILTAHPWSRLESSSFRLGPWSSTFLVAEEVLHAMERGEGDLEKAKDLFRKLLRMAISRDERVLKLADKYLTLADIVNMRMRMIGTGLIGGKAVGFLLARGILRTAREKWADLLEPADAFFIGSDVFYTFLVQNGLWWVRQKQRNPATYLEGAEEARRRILTGNFPDYINKQFADMLDYFGQSPIIVRSSTVLEDNFDASHAGKLKSVFCANQGPRHGRLEDFLSAVKTIYASSMSKEALVYRAQKGILEQEEQTAIIIQRVSGGLHGSYFYPHISGVGFSFNPYVWSEHIDPNAGMIRLVFGLGTRAVNRSDDDYTRVVALNAPERRPEANFDEVRQFAQRKVDVLDLESNHFITAHFVDVAGQSRELPLDMFASRDAELERLAAERGTINIFSWVLTFEKLLKETGFVADIREMLRTLQEAYSCPVDVEFAANVTENGKYRINLLQCRPLQIKGSGAIAEMPEGIDDNNVIIKSEGPIIGRSRFIDIDRIIYVVPSAYSKLSNNDRILIAKIIGRIVLLQEPGMPKTTMLIGPGRWGTTTPALGVPVNFSEINTVSALCEVVTMSEDLVPDVSLGTHFFNELVERDIIYIAIYPSKKESRINEDFFTKGLNRLPLLLPDAANWSEVISVIDTPSEESEILLHADTLKQKAICFANRNKK